MENLMSNLEGKLAVLGTSSWKLWRIITQNKKLLFFTSTCPAWETILLSLDIYCY